MGKRKDARLATHKILDATYGGTTITYLLEAILTRFVTDQKFESGTLVDLQRELQDRCAEHGITPEQFTDCLKVRGRGAKPETPMWTTRDGETLKLTDMKTSHLLNCLRMAIRNGAPKHCRKVETGAALINELGDANVAFRDLCDEFKQREIPLAISEELTEYAQGYLDVARRDVGHGFMFATIDQDPWIEDDSGQW